MLDVLAIIRRVLKKSFSCFDWLSTCSGRPVEY